MTYYVGAPEVCDVCNKDFGQVMYDSKMRVGPWGNLCQSCWERHGVGRLGIGFGQKYFRQEDGRWKLIEGGE